MGDNILLRVENLRVTFGKHEAVKGVSIELHRGEMLALVGESGSGKTVTCRSLLGLPPSGSVVTYEVLERPEARKMSLVMQNAMTTLDPAMPVWKQIVEGCGGTRSRAIELLNSVGIDAPELRAKQYPPHFSGGMRQRVAVAVALAMEPAVIFADEPTTSLDADIRLQIMAMLSGLRKDGSRAVLFVTHDLSLVRYFADRVMIMQDGEIIEQGATAGIFENPQMEYTRELLHYSQYHHAAEHTHSNHAHTLSGSTLVEAANIGKIYELPNRKKLQVLNGVSIAIYKGEIVGLCGRSGIGKSTLARILSGIERPTNGTVRYADNLRVQMVFQDSVSALNPRMTIEQIIAEPLLLRDGKKPGREAVLELMRQCELEPELFMRRPDEISGGQRQRAAIARAISTDPQLIIADEPVSSLDVTTCSKIIHLLRKIQHERGLSILLISHDLPLLNHICDRIITL